MRISTHGSRREGCERIASVGSGRVRSQYLTYHRSGGHGGIGSLAYAHAPDVVLPDSMMPRLRGLELARIVLADPAVPRMVITVMSGAPVPGLAAAARGTFLAKPFAIDAGVVLVARCTLPERSNDDIIPA